MLTRYEQSTTYSRKTGNMYTGSLYLGLISLLENEQNLQANERIGLFSYGSGSVAEFFSMRLVEGYQQHLLSDLHKKQFDQRTKLSIEEYESMFSDQLNIETDNEFNDQTPYSIVKTNNTIRYYYE
ncbi:hypothetical protein GCM10025853_14800 [Tetragenococcus halophilus subsp. halophilus DSM 20339]|nr:hypothetical protein GCM10025853_14800 [Tetragenococcus halophilus subsp. halophilus DSM 20339]